MDGLGRSFWFHSPDGVTPDQPMGGVLWPESGGHSIYQDSEQGREFRRRLVEGRLTAEDGHQHYPRVLPQDVEAPGEEEDCEW